MCRVNNLTTFMCWLPQNLGSSVLWKTLGLFRVCFTISCIWTTSRYHDCLHCVIKGPYVNTSEQIYIQQYSFINKHIAIQYPGDCHPSIWTHLWPSIMSHYHMTYTVISVSNTFSSHCCAYNKNIPKLLQGLGMYRQLSYYYIYFI